jgi:Transglycosylase-like domain
MTPAVPAAGAAAALLAIAAAAHAAPDADDPQSPLRTELRAPIAGHVTVAAQMRAARRDVQERRLRRRVTRLERRVARVRGERPDRPRLRGDSPAALRGRVASLQRELTYERVAIPPQLAAIAACESGGDPAAIGGGGLYRGKYQFDFQTWASVGGTGDPAAAPEAEQDMRAAMLYSQAGSSPWPICG